MKNITSGRSRFGYAVVTVFACAVALDLAIAIAGVSALAYAEAPAVSVTGVPADQDSTILIRKGDHTKTTETEYRVDSGSEEISGDPLSGQAESYDSWKKACADWKKDMREMNGKTLIALSCGFPHAERDKSSRMTQTSTGTYKIKVRVRETGAPLDN